MRPRPVPPTRPDTSGMSEQSVVWPDGLDHTGLGSSSPARRWSLLLASHWELAVAAVALIAATVAVWITLRADFLAYPGWLAVQKADFIVGPIGVGLFVWIGTHRDQLVAALELVFAAVQEAESYLTMTGPEKKAFAHDLVLAVLDEIGFEERAGLMLAIVNSMISGAIEASVAIFNKRGAFDHRSAA